MSTKEKNPNNKTQKTPPKTQEETKTFGLGPDYETEVTPAFANNPYGHPAETPCHTREGALALLTDLQALLMGTGTRNQPPRQPLRVVTGSEPPSPLRTEPAAGQLLPRTRGGFPLLSTCLQIITK